LTIFSHAVTPRVALSTDLRMVRAELAVITPWGDTSVLDGVYAAITTTLAEPGRTLLVVYTDGTDTSSWLQPEEAVEAVRRSNAVIYAVTSVEQRRGSDLELLTAASGGQMIRVPRSGDLRPAFQRILQDFRTRYVLAYAPNGVSAGGYHRLDVGVKRRGLTVRARPGYIGVGAAR
jgi:VWFA-related protein